MDNMEDRISAACAIAGCVLLGLGTSMHPMHADPNNAAAVFAEYAADPNWTFSHLLQFAGAALLVAFMLLLVRQLRGSMAVLQPLASGGAIASLSAAAALQAVDGVALKAAVDAWAGAPAVEKAAAFSAAFAVRQIEIALASLLSILFGATAALYGLLLYGDGRYPTWIGSIAVAGGIGFSVGGAVIAYSGFSAMAMNLQMPASLLLLTWIVAVAAILWRRSQLPPAG